MSPTLKSNLNATRQALGASAVPLYGDSPAKEKEEPAAKGKDVMAGDAALAKNASRRFFHIQNLKGVSTPQQKNIPGYGDEECVALSSIDNPEIKNLLGPFEHREVLVKKETLEVMTILKEQMVIARREYLPNDFGNKKVSIYKTGGLSTLRLIKVREENRYAVSALYDAKGAVKNGGGGCFEAARVLQCLMVDALKARGIKRPIYTVGDLDEDHTYILIGDPEDPENTVVGDIYTDFFAPHTLAEAERARPNYESPEDEYDPEGDTTTVAFNTSCLSKVKRDSDEVIMEFGKSRNIPEVGHPLLKWVAEQNKKTKEKGDANDEAGECFDDVKTAKDLSTIYKDAEGNSITFEYFPVKEVNEYFEAREAMEKSGFPDNFN